MIPFELPELDRKSTQKAVEAKLERYRLYKHLNVVEREANITSSSEERLHGPTHDISDQTGSIAAFNIDNRNKRESYCTHIESIVGMLPELERRLIEARYLSFESEYTTDQDVYEIKLDPPMSKPTYTRIRWKALYKIALSLDVAYIRRNSG